jgi:hypothetical protein
VTRRRTGWLFALAVVVNLAILFWPRAVGGGAGLGLDKVVHAASFGLVAFTGLRAGLLPRWLLPLLAAHAVSSELIQHTLLPARSGDPADVVADLAGVVLGLLGARWRHDDRTLDGEPHRTAAGGDPRTG